MRLSSYPTRPRSTRHSGCDLSNTGGMHTIRRVLPASPSPGAALALAGCGGGTPDDTGSAGSTTRSPRPRQGRPTEPTAGQSGSSRRRARGPASCTIADLKVTLSAGEGAAGSTFYRSGSPTRSDRPCRTGGFGGVSLVGAAPPTDRAPADRTTKDKRHPDHAAPGGRRGDPAGHHGRELPGRDVPAGPGGGVPGLPAQRDHVGVRPRRRDRLPRRLRAPVEAVALPARGMRLVSSGTKDP